MPSRPPQRNEAADYYFTYIDQVGPGDIREQLETQGRSAGAVWDGIGEQRSLYRYASDKWSIKEVLAHLNDTERLFLFRAFWFARGFETPLPSFDQNIAMSFAQAEARSWQSHVDEFRAVRAATVAFFRSLPAEAWDRRGVASDNPFSVRALAYIGAGHVAHHVRILREWYGVDA